MILLLGATGYVGKAFQKYFNHNNITYCTYQIRYQFNELKLIEFINANKVTAIFNCAGYTGKPNVDTCEANKVETLQANAFLPKQLDKVCRKLCIKLVQISSGCIFNDTQCEQGLPPITEYRDFDTPNFAFLDKKASWYSGTKALGETLINDRHNLICRLRIPFNGEINPRNYITKIINYSNLLNSTNSFSQLEEFVAAVYRLYALNLSGIFNVTQPGYMTTKEVVELLQKHEIITYDKQYFKSIEEFESTCAAPRSNCVLDSSYTELYAKLTPIKQAMEEAIISYKQQLLK
jgi:dTDP-4-dehydrorhamnose reductase